MQHDPLTNPLLPQVHTHSHTLYTQHEPIHLSTYTNSKILTPIDRQNGYWLRTSAAKQNTWNKTIFFNVVP